MGTGEGGVQTLKDLGRSMLAMGAIRPTPDPKVRPELAMMMLWMARQETHRTQAFTERIAEELVKEVNEGAGRAYEEYQALLREFFVVAQISWEWANYGFPTFRLTEALCAGLSMTSCQGLPADEIRFPFPAFMVVLPESMSHRDREIIDELAPGPKTDVACRRIIVSNAIYAEHRTMPKRPDWKAVLRLVVQNIESQELLIDEPGLKRGFWDVVETQSRGLLGDLIGSKEVWKKHFVMQFMTDHGITGGALSPLPCWFSDAEDFVNLSGLDHLRCDSKLDVAPRLDAEKFARRIVVNLCTYLAMRPEDWPARKKKAATRSKKKKKKLAVERYNEDRKDWTVGKAVQLPEQLVRAARESTRGRAGRLLNKRLFVQGHWRNQACGKGRAERKRIWIEPFYKGPSGAKQIEKLYDVKTLEEAGMTDS